MYRGTYTIGLCRALLLTLLLLFSTVGVLWSQPQKVDSLRKVALQAKPPKRFGLLRSLIEAEWFLDPETSLQDLATLETEAKAAGDHYHHAWSLNYRGVILSQMRRLDEADSCLALAEQLMNRHNIRQLRRDILTNKGLNAHQRGNFRKAAELYLTALHIQEAEAPDDFAGEGDICSNLALLYNQLDSTALAETYFRRAIRAYQHSAEKGRSYANTLNSYGSLLYRKGDIDSSLFYLKESIAIHQKIGNLPGQIGGLINTGILENQRGSVHEAIAYYQQAKHLSLSSHDDDNLSVALINLASAYNQLGNYRQAITYADSSLALAFRLQDNHLRKAVYDVLATAHERLGNYQQALRYSRTATALQDSMASQQTAQRIAEMEINLENERNKRALAEEKRQRAQAALAVTKRNRWLMLAVLALVFTGLGGGYWIRTERRKRAQLRRETQLKEKLAHAELNNRLHAEKSRISRDLHDNIGSQLTLMIASLEGAPHAPASGTNGTPHSEQHRKELQQLARNTMVDLRNTVWLINKDERTLEEITDRLQGQLRPLKQYFSTDIQINLSGDTQCTLPPEHALHLFRILQEAVNNALKHADADTIRIWLESQPGVLNITVEDDGKGLPTTQASGTGGFGLRTMRERAESLHGKLALHSAPGQGTRVELQLPL